MSRTFCLPLLLLTVLSSSALADIHKCDVDGKTVYTDQACPDNTARDFAPPELNGTPASAGFSYRGSAWLHDSDGYRTATEASVTENAPVLIYAYTDWCHFCKRLDALVFSDLGVQDKLSNFIKVKVNPEHGKEELRLFRSWRGKGYPTLYLQYPHGQPRQIARPPTEEGGLIELRNHFADQLQSYLDSMPKQEPAKNPL